MDWAREAASQIEKEAKSLGAAAVGEDLNRPRDGIRGLAKVRRRLPYVDYSSGGRQEEKDGVPSVAVNPMGTAASCPEVLLGAEGG